MTHVESLLLEVSVLRFLGIYENKLFRETPFLAEPGHLCLDNFKMNSMQILIRIYRAVQEL